MKKNSFLKQNVLLILFLAGSLAVKACWAPIPIKQQLSDAHLVATGKVSSTSSFLNSERFIYIKVDKILKNDLDGYPVKPGDKVKVILPKLKGYSTDFKFETGDAGLWMLKYSDGAFRARFPMVRSSIPEAKAAKILKDLRSQYELALKTTIPERDKYLKLVLSIPAYPAEKALKKLNVPLRGDIDLSRVYVQSQYPKSNYSTIIMPNGKVLSVIPYSAGKCFKDGLLPVTQGQSTAFLNRKLELSPPKTETKEKSPDKVYTASPVSNGGWVFSKRISKNVSRIITPTLYIVVSAFSSPPNVVRTSKKLLEIKGEVVAASMKPGDVSNGVAIVKFPRNSYKVFNGKGDILHVFRLPEGYSIGMHQWPAPIYDGLCLVKKKYKYGFINLEGKVVIAPVFDSILNFTGGLAPFVKESRREFPYWGLMDKTGKEIVKPGFTRFNWAQYDPENGYNASVKVLSWVPKGKIKSPNGKVKLAASAAKYSLQPGDGVINARGEWIIPPVFYYISKFENGLAEVFWRGRIVTPNAPFSALINRRGDVVFVMKNNVEDTKIKP